jgi:hypothetical protein
MKSYIARRAAPPLTPRSSLPNVNSVLGAFAIRIARLFARGLEPDNNILTLSRCTFAGKLRVLASDTAYESNESATLNREHTLHSVPQGYIIRRNKTAFRIGDFPLRYGPLSHPHKSSMYVLF